MPIIAERLERLSTIMLKRGMHDSFESGACAMEALSWVTGQPWSDHPPCVSPVLGAFMRSWNDCIPDDVERTALLLPLIPNLVDTRGSVALEHRRAIMAADWLVRTHAPAWLRLAGLERQAEVLADLPEITDFAQCPTLMPTIIAVRDDAVAASDAAGAAAWDTAWVAAASAAVSAVVSAAAEHAAGAAAEHAAGAAAGAAVLDVIGEAAWAAALAGTRAELQQSATALVARMCAQTDG